MVENMPVVSIDSTLFWQMINFLIIIYIFKRYFFKPMGKFLEKRQELIKKEIEEAKNNLAESEKAKKDAEETLKSAKKEANELLLSAERKAEDRKDSILKETYAQRDKMIKSGEAEVIKMREQARKEIEKYVREIATDLAEKLIADKTQVDLIDEAINKVGEE
ncbi:MAG: F-type H+-transporting ATPase subunit b [Fusobacteriaceae bacterium]|jgi:F-type H+-transporting ATPase subunit b|nr:synthase subunit [Fusobacteriales bacterium]MDN5303212.1 F-type H+-transporting ATPase subunit b [Fusobacteriaceae bacterium]